MRDITLLLPPLQQIAYEFESRADNIGYDIKITETFRTKEEQNKLYKQVPKVTTVEYPYSLHCFGLAFDICLNDSKNPYPNDTKFWSEMGKIGKELGLGWGGDWTNPVDRPHFQIEAYGEYGTEVVKNLKNPIKFMKTSAWDSIPTQVKNVIKLSTKSSKNDIILVQAALNICGYPCKITGKYDQESQRAYRSFRSSKGTWVKGESITETGLKKLFKEAGWM